MYESIDLDAIESNRDEAPDYRPFLKGSGLGAPVTVDRMRYLATLETEEKARYSEFSKAADDEGLQKIAMMFKGMMQDEDEHSGDIGGTKTLMNLKTALKREKDKAGIIRSMINDAVASGDEENARRLQRMLVEEELHIRKLEEALREVEADVKKRYKSKDEYYCSYGVCVPKSEDE